jgi:hypothetical protein
MNDLVVEILTRAATDLDRRRRMAEQRPRAEKLRRALRRRFGPPHRPRSCCAATGGGEDCS